MPGDGFTHGPPANEKAGGSDQGLSRINRHSLRNGVTAYTRPPRCPGFLATVTCRSSPASLIPASGDQDHATSPSASATFVRRSIRVHRIPAPRFVTIGRNVPLHRGGMRETLLVICPTRQARRHAADWHDGQNGHSVYAGFTRRVAAATLARHGAHHLNVHVGRQALRQLVLGVNQEFWMGTSFLLFIAANRSA
jgi:hypothetical protein